jgi:hypothetical protein
MKLLTMQPAFRLEVPVHGGELMKRVRKVIQSPELRDRVRSAGDCIDFAVDASERRFWSPHLNVEVSNVEVSDVEVSDVDGGSQLFCRFSPRPEVWTMVMMIYFVATFFITGAAIYGYVQWFLGQTPWSLALIPSAAVVVISLHVASLVGQSLSADQMEELRHRLDKTLASALADQDDAEEGSAKDFRVDQAADASDFKPQSAPVNRADHRDPDEQLR